ncbi:MAG: hypothetical protein ACLP81_09460, partial [Acidimicrobiales bacterium]
MSTPRRTGAPGADGPADPEVAALVEHFLDTAAATHDRDVLRGIVQAVLELARGDASRLDLKLARAALGE